MSKESSVKDRHAFWRMLILPQEDKEMPWDGIGYRWFRSPNVVPIEQWRRRTSENVRQEQTPPPE
jgi:hypothetical protein